MKSHVHVWRLMIRREMVDYREQAALPSGPVSDVLELLRYYFSGDVSHDLATEIITFHRREPPRLPEGWHVDFQEGTTIEGAVPENLPNPHTSTFVLRHIEEVSGGPGSVTLMFSFRVVEHPEIGRVTRCMTIREDMLPQGRRLRDLPIRLLGGLRMVVEDRPGHPDLNRITEIATRFTDYFLYALINGVRRSDSDIWSLREFVSFIQGCLGRLDLRTIEVRVETIAELLRRQRPVPVVRETPTRAADESRPRVVPSPTVAPPPVTGPSPRAPLGVVQQVAESDAVLVMEELRRLQEAIADEVAGRRNDGGDGV